MNNKKEHPAATATPAPTETVSDDVVTAARVEAVAVLELAANRVRLRLATLEAEIAELTGTAAPEPWDALDDALATSNPYVGVSREGAPLPSPWEAKPRSKSTGGTCTLNPHVTRGGGGE